MRSKYGIYMLPILGIFQGAVFADDAAGTRSRTDCYCGKDTGAANLCFENRTCQGITVCANNAACGAGMKCVVDTCCPAPAGMGVCVVECAEKGCTIGMGRGVCNKYDRCLAGPELCTAAEEGSVVGTGLPLVCPALSGYGSVVLGVLVLASGAALVKGRRSRRHATT